MRPSAGVVGERVKAACAAVRCTIWNLLAGARLRADVRARMRTHVRARGCAMGCAQVRRTNFRSSTRAWVAWSVDVQCDTCQLNIMSAFPKVAM